MQDADYRGESTPPSQESERQVPALAIGSDTWPGLAKLAEECGEVLQVIAKVCAFPDSEHPDGAGPLAQRLEEEMGDLLGALWFVMETCDRVDDQRVDNRAITKYARFRNWHKEEQTAA